jgi:3-oxoadipate enol-lactonase
MPVVDHASAEASPMRDILQAAALDRFANGVLSVAPLLQSLEEPVRIALYNEGASRDADLATSEAILNSLTAKLCARQALLETPETGLASPPRGQQGYSSTDPNNRQFVLLPTNAVDATAFEIAIGRRLGLDAAGLSSLARPPTPAEIDHVSASAIGCSLHSPTCRAVIHTADGARLAAYALGDRRLPPVVIASACGMPVELCKPWLRTLALQHYVLTIESRCLFETGPSFDPTTASVYAQANDLFAVMDHFAVQRAHVMGICGGAVIALAAASARPERVASLSLWHGDYELGADCPKTQHQEDVQMLMQTARRSHAAAASLRKMFISPATLEGLREDLAHLLLYPYATAELFFRYAHLNGSIMTEDVTAILGAVPQPTLVVTSEDDATAHPAGSRRVAAGLGAAELHVRPHGDHLSLFAAEPQLVQLLLNFISRHP